MKVCISKWGNSIGVRIPRKIAESLALKTGDDVECAVKDGGLFLKKEQSTARMFEEFYGKPYDQITENDIGPGEELDWGEDVGGEVF